MRGLGKWDAGLGEGGECAWMNLKAKAVVHDPLARLANGSNYGIVEQIGGATAESAAAAGESASGH